MDKGPLKDRKILIQLQFKSQKRNTQKNILNKYARYLQVNLEKLIIIYQKKKQKTKCG